MVHSEAHAGALVKLTLGRSARAAFGLGLLGLVSASAVSCVNLLELDRYGSAAHQLCALLAECYGADFYPNCLQRAEPRVTTASEGQRGAWLIRFAESHCLESCLNASACLDMPPLCGGQGEHCDKNEQCCGFSVGTGDCRDRCCLSDGVSCTDTAQCCDSACEDGFCGGVECKIPAADCANDFECCTNICSPLTNSCHPRSCVADSTECSYDFECCSQSCIVTAGQTIGTCGDPSCVATTGDCVNPPGTTVSPSTACCGGYCVSLIEGISVCSDGGCRPDTMPCSPGSLAPEDQCCSGYCDPTFDRCATETPCGDIGAACISSTSCCSGHCNQNNDGEGACACLVDGSPCEDNFQCCNGDCSNNNCQGPGSCKLAPEQCDDAGECCSGICRADQCCNFINCSHSVCQLGDPLATNCHCSGCSDAALDDCPAKVCLGDPSREIAGDPTCCCEQWHEGCVDLAEMLCGISCQTVVPPSR